jgi:hypothetical protein
MWLPSLTPRAGCCGQALVTVIASEAKQSTQLHPQRLDRHGPSGLAMTSWQTSPSGPAMTT